MENASADVPKSRIGYGYLIIVFVLWGSLYVVSKYVLGKLPVFTISFVRFTLAYLALTLFQRGKKQKVEREAKPYIFLIGAAGYFIAVGAQLLGTKYIGASAASLMNALNPITMVIFAAMILKEKLTVKKILGILLAVAGVYVIIGRGAENINSFGVILSLFAVLLWSFVSVCTRRATGKYELLQITRYAVGIAALCYLPVCIYEVVYTGGIEVDISCILSLIYMGVVCTGVAYLLWNKSLSLLPAGTCSAFYPIQPMVSAMLGALFLQETIGISFIIGAGLIVAGILISLYAPLKKH